MNEPHWVSPKWLEWVQIVWNVMVGVGLVIVVALAFFDLAQGWMMVAVVAAGLPCALLNHLVAEREGRPLPPD